MGKQALMVVSFGTSYDVALPAIENIERICKEAYPDHDFYRAWTSGMIIRKLARTKNIIIHNPEEVMEHLAREGYEEVLCQPTHIINGVENDKMISMLMKFRDKIPSIKIGSPLFTEQKDYEKVCEIVMKELGAPLGEDEAFVLMGHGTDHHANSAYCQFENTLRNNGYENVYVGTVEGFPDIDYVIDRLKKKGVKKATLMPLMIVAGDHARNDLAGEEEDSWKSIMEKEGFETSIILKGLGEIDAIGDVLVEHLGV